MSSLQQVQVGVAVPSPYLITSHQHGRQTPPRTPRPQKHPLLPPGKSLPALVVPPLTVPQVAINSSKRRDALPLEKLGEYDPIPRPAPTSTSLAHAIEKSFHLASRAPTADELREKREKRIVWDVERVRYWLGVGAQPSESVVKLLERVSRRFFWVWLERVESEDGRSVRLKPRMSATRGASQHGLRVERHDTGARASEDVQFAGRYHARAACTQDDIRKCRREHPDHDRHRGAGNEHSMGTHGASTKRIVRMDGPRKSWDSSWAMHTDGRPRWTTGCVPYGLRITRELSPRSTTTKSRRATLGITSFRPNRRRGSHKQPFANNITDTSFPFFPSPAFPRFPTINPPLQQSQTGVLEGDHKWRISPARRGKGKPKEQKTEAEA